jgi:hypothetical protein
VTHPTITARVIEELRRSSRPLDDDELARRLDVRPRQTINQACRKLEIAGALRRYVGQVGKIVNELRIRGTVASADSELVTEELLPEPPAGDSAVQRRAEAVMLRLIGARLGVNFVASPVRAERGRSGRGGRGR